MRRILFTFFLEIKNKLLLFLFYFILELWLLDCFIVEFAIERSRGEGKI